MALTKEQILGASDSKVQAIDVPEWGGECFIRVLPGPDLDAMVTAQARLGGEKSTQPSRLAAEIVGRCLCDENGVRMFADSDIGALAGKSAAVLGRVATAAMELNGLTEASAEAIAGN